MRCRGCGALAISVGEKCPVCGLPYLARKDGLEGAKDLVARLKSEAKQRPIEQLRDYYMKAQQDGVPIHMSRTDLERLKKVQDDLKRNPGETMLRIQEGYYD
jgi:hypothetical protein